ncbi:MAG: hypothetical protein ACYS8I_09830 [Planctomycetota bacterium]
MVEEEFCRQCSGKPDCQEVYERLGRAEGPSVVTKVVLAFLLPLVVFIVLLVACEKVLVAGIGSKGLRTAVSFLSACLGTLGVVVLVKVISGRLGKDG